ncbi:hypothetical protein ACIPXV_09555 [Streptomyces libani]|uniref:hypothetical protein n=1 Tax=Streptomyces nigrescens TaxID=1920 RepID=UPI0037F856BA
MNQALWRIALILWFPVAFVAFGVCVVPALLPAAAVWVVTGDSERAFRVATFGRTIWWDTTNRIADHAQAAAA